MCEYSISHSNMKNTHSQKQVRLIADSSQAPTIHLIPQSQQLQLHLRGAQVPRVLHISSISGYT